MSLSGNEEELFVAKSSITAFAVAKVEEKAGLWGNKTVEEEVLRMDTAGGSIYLKRSAVERAGDSWTRVKRRFSTLAGEKNIPFTDQTK